MSVGPRHGVCQDSACVLRSETVALAREAACVGRSETVVLARTRHVPVYRSETVAFARTRLVAVAQEADSVASVQDLPKAYRLASKSCSFASRPPPPPPPFSF